MILPNIARRRRYKPEAPRGVRLVLPTGDELTIEVEYRGENVNGVHEWVGVAPDELIAGTQLRVDILPARTSVVIAPPPNAARGRHPEG